MSDKLIDLVDAMWSAAEDVPNGGKDEYWMAADLRVRVLALCEVVRSQAHAAGVAAERARVVAVIEEVLEGLGEWYSTEAGPALEGVLDKVRTP